MIKLEIEMGKESEDSAEKIKEIIKKVQGVKTIKDLRKLQEEMGTGDYGLKEDEKPMENDVTEDRLEGEQDMTPDDKAEKEDKETRVKNSKNPTIVGRMMK